MRVCLRHLRNAFPLLLACLLVAPAAISQNASPKPSPNSSPDRTQFGSDIIVGPNEEISDATCFGCSVHVRGHVAGDVTVFFGSISIEDQGEVAGDITDFGRGVRLDRSTKVGGDVTVFGGPVRRNSDASVGGDVTQFNGIAWLFLVFGLPFAVLGGVVVFVVWLVRRLTRPAMPVTA